MKENEIVKKSKVHRKVYLERIDSMNYSREVIFLRVPDEINALFYGILFFFMCLIAFIAFFKINDVIKVSGIVRTQANISTVKNVISGKINCIEYKPEQYVEKDDVLFTIDDEVYLTLISEINSELEKIERQMDCTEKVLNGYLLGRNLLTDKNDLAFSQLEEYLKTIDYLKRQIEIAEFQLKIEKDQPEAFINKQNIEKCYLSYCLQIDELTKFKANFYSQLMQNREALRIEHEKLIQQKLRTEKQYSYLVIKAPVSGYVQEISSLNIGDYVLQDQNVLNIIPDDKKNYRVELTVAAKDIGEIRENMEIKYRLSAFPFYEYRGAVGKITSIDSDIRQTSDGKIFYRIYSDIDKIVFTNGKGKSFPIRAGIDVDARIVLEKMSVLHFILRKMDFIR